MRSADPTVPTDRASWWGLLVLIALGLYTYMDRQIIGLQAEPILRQLALSDAQLGLIQGAGVALVTALAGYPIGWLADRCDRRHVLAGCLVVWCLAVALCGMATSFPEWFQGRRRPVANSAFVFLGRLSAGLVIVACGWLIHSVDLWRHHLPGLLQDVPAWRLVLGAAALPGLLLLPLVFTLPPMHVRAVAQTPVRVAAVLRSNPAAFAAILGGAGLLSLGANAFGTFVPVAVARAWGVPPLQAGQGLGAAALAGAVSALAITAVLTRLSGLTQRHGTAMALAAFALACSAATALGAPLASSPAMFLALYGLSLAGVMTAVMLLPTALQPLCPPQVRVRLMSLFVGTTIVVGSAGPVVVGALSDGFGGTARGLIMAMATVALVSHAMAAMLLTWGARRCAHDVPADDGAQLARATPAGRMPQPS